MNCQDQAGLLLDEFDSSVRVIARQCRYAHWQTIQRQLKALREISAKLKQIANQLTEENKN